MSLVNDALKRAQELQDQKRPVAANLEFQPVHPAQAVRDPWLHVVPAILAIIGLSSVVLAGKLALQSKSPRAAEVRAKAPQPQVVAALPANPIPKPTSNPKVVAVKSQAKPAAAPASVAAPAPAPAKASPPPLKLQAIFYSPAKPTAVISGKSLNLGDVIGGQRVAAITRHSVDLVGSNRTNRLTLPD